MLKMALASTLILAALAMTACEDDKPASTSTTPGATATARLLPPPIAISPEPQEIGLRDPAFDALPNTTADYGHLGGTVYQVEMPKDWNGKLVLYMHGFQGLAPEASVDPPGIRGYLIRNGYAWGASSYSSTALIPGRAADETAALWDYFAKKYGQPQRTYVMGHSMGGGATGISAERYGDRYDGALDLCGMVGQTPQTVAVGDYLFAAAFVAGVTQAEFDTTPTNELIEQRLLPALQGEAAHERWVNIMLDMTGGDRAFARKGFALEEETNWIRSDILVSAGLAFNRNTEYQLGPLAGVSSETFNRAVVRKDPAGEGSISNFNKGNEFSGDIRMPLLTMHTTGDWQVPIDQHQILRRAVEAAGKQDLLVQRTVAEAGHCAFTNAEWEQGFEDLVAWVEEAKKPDGEDLLVDDLMVLGARFSLAPRFGTPEADAVPGAGERLALSGAITLDGAPVSDGGYIQVSVRNGGIGRVCTFGFPSASDGRYDLLVAADSEARGCGRPGAEIVLGIYTSGEFYGAQTAAVWPVGGRPLTYDVQLSRSNQYGLTTAGTLVQGEALDASGERKLPGTLIEAYVGETLCGVTSVPYVVFNYDDPSTYAIRIAGEDVIPACTNDREISFRVDGQPARETAKHSLGRELLDLTPAE